MCGSQCFPNVVLGTIFWSKARLSIENMSLAERSEEELLTTDEFWKDMIAGGSTVVRIPETRAEARELLLDMCDREPQALEAQVEQVDQRKVFEETSAAQSIDTEIARIQKEHFSDLRKVAQRQECEMREKAKRVERDKICLAAALKREEQERTHLAEQKRKEEQEEEKRLEAVKVEQKKRDEQQSELEKRLAKFQIDEANEKRQSEITAYFEVVDSSLELLQRGVVSGRVKEDYIHTPSGAYTLACDNCFSNIGSGTYFRPFPKAVHICSAIC